MSDELALRQSQNDGLSLIPESHKYSQNYRVTRINLPPIDITEETAHFVFKKILEGDHAIVLGKHLVMCSCISSIDPLPIKQKPANGHYEGDKWINE